MVGGNISDHNVGLGGQLTNKVEKYKYFNHCGRCNR